MALLQLKRLPAGGEMISFFMWFRSSSSPTFFAARASYSLRKAEGSWTDTLPPISEAVHTLSAVREVVNARRVQTDRSGLRVVAGERGSGSSARGRGNRELITGCGETKRMKSETVLPFSKKVRYGTLENSRHPQQFDCARNPATPWGKWIGFQSPCNSQLTL